MFNLRSILWVWKRSFFFALLLKKISLVVDSCYFLAEALVLYSRLYKCKSNKTCTAKISCSTDHEKSSTNKNIFPKVITHAFLNFEIWGEILFCCIYKILDARILEELWRNTSIDWSFIIHMTMTRGVISMSLLFDKIYLLEGTYRKKPTTFFCLLVITINNIPNNLLIIMNYSKLWYKSSNNR